jgi:hypothetical protein
VSSKCSVEGCDNPSNARGLCRAHYQRAALRGTLNHFPRKLPYERPLCSIPDCSEPHLAHGWCRVHYDRWRRRGTPVSLVRAKL